MSKEIPVYKKDIYSTKSLKAGNLLYKELQDLGEVVYHKKRKLYLLTSYEAVTTVLRNSKVFSCEGGVALTEATNKAQDLSPLSMDGTYHAKIKKWYMKPITQKKLRDIKDQISDSSEQLVKDLMQKEKFDVVKDFAAHLPLSIVSKLIGYPEKGRAKLLEWAFASFNTMGPTNWRTIKSLPKLIFGLSKYAQSLTEESVAPGSWSAAMFQAIKKGELSEREGKSIVMGYAIPSLDTTIASVSYMFWELAKNPKQFKEIKANPDLIPGVINEILRLSCPVRGFKRNVTEDYDYKGYTIPKGATIIVLLPGANRDPKKYPNPDTFDVHRNPRDHVAWGFGSHFCAGAHLARLELEELLKALVKHADKLEISEPHYFLNNTLMGFESLTGKLN